MHLIMQTMGIYCICTASSRALNWIPLCRCTFVLTSSVWTCANIYWRHKKNVKLLIRVLENVVTTAVGLFWLLKVNAFRMILSIDNSELKRKQLLNRLVRCSKPPTDVAVAGMSTTVFDGIFCMRLSSCRCFDQTYSSFVMHLEEAEKRLPQIDVLDTSNNRKHQKPGVVKYIILEYMSLILFSATSATMYLNVRFGCSQLDRPHVADRT